MVDFSKRTGVREQAYVNAYAEDGVLHLLYRDEKGALREKTTKAEYVLYLAMTDVETHGLERKFRQSDYVDSMKQEGDWLRISWKNSRVSRTYKDADGKQRTHQVQYRDLMAQDKESPLHKWGVQTYEGDVHPVRRFMVDHNTPIQKPRRLYTDIETDSRVSFAKAREGEARILSFAVTDDDDNERVEVLEEDTDEAEAKLLAKFWKIAEDYDQIIAWNGDRFDFPLFEHRTVKAKLPVNFRRWLWLDHLALFKRMNVTASESGDEKTSMKLNDVAQAVLNEKKDEFDGSKTYQVWAAGGAERERLARYNMQDTRLLKRLEEKTGYIELFFTLCDACGIFPDSKGTNPTHQVDSFLLRLGLKNGVHFRTMVYGAGSEEHEQYKGAMVMDPPDKAGVIQDVHVGDFARLYPSIIITWNMSPETKHSVAVPPREIPEGCSRAPFTNVCFRTDKRGILPLALDEMIRLRKFWNDKKASCAPGTPEWVEADRRSTAYKIAANSFYGVIGSVFSRYFDRQVGESVTQAGVYLIQRTRDEAEKRVSVINGMQVRWRVIYIDTDSIFVIGPTKEEFYAFVKWCNEELYPKLLAKLGCVVNDISLAYEKQFARIVFTGKKRYAGKFVHYKGKAAAKDSKPEIKGLEFKRGDTAKLARKLQERIIIEVITAECDDAMTIDAFICEMKDYVLNQPVKLEECAISKNIGKEIHEYKTKTKKDGTEQAKPAQVQIAEILKSRGLEVGVGSKVSYVVVDGKSSPMKYLPAVDFTGTELDRYYLWENLVWPPTERFVEQAFPLHNWDAHAKVRPKSPRKAPVRKPRDPGAPATRGRRMKEPAPPNVGRCDEQKNEEPRSTAPEPIASALIEEPKVKRSARRVKDTQPDPRQMVIPQTMKDAVTKVINDAIYAPTVWVIGAPKAASPA